MTNVYLVKFTNNDLLYSYTSIEAIFAAHTKEEIGITLKSFYNAISGKTFYKNRRITVNKIIAYNKTDVESNLHSGAVIKS